MPAPAPRPTSTRRTTGRHQCPGTDDDGRPLRPERATCGNCGRSWCDRCDPVAVSALCHYCHGRGYSDAPLPNIQDGDWTTEAPDHGR